LPYQRAEAASHTSSGELSLLVCTKSGHGSVDRLHLIENTCSYEVRFFVDSKTRSQYKHTRSLTTSSVFPVGAASGAQTQSLSALRKCQREGGQGSTAKRWSRRTGSKVKGRIEFRGVKSIYPVGGEPGARAKIARGGPAKGGIVSRSSKGLKRATG